MNLAPETLQKIDEVITHYPVKRSAALPLLHLVQEEQGHISTACCILGNIALQVGRTLAWDSAAGRVAGDEEANRLLRRPYRQPWVHPEPGRV